MAQTLRCRLRCRRHNTAHTDCRCGHTFGIQIKGLAEDSTAPALYWPMHVGPLVCPSCGRTTWIFVLGWALNPTSEQPATEYPNLAATVSSLNQALQLPHS